MSGNSKLVKKIRQEVKFLERSAESKGRKAIKMEHLECSNLTHLKAIVKALMASHQPSDALKTFQYQQLQSFPDHSDDDAEEEQTILPVPQVVATRKLTVDVVCNQGLDWIKVRSRRFANIPSRCLMLFTK